MKNLFLPVLLLTCIYSHAQLTTVPNGGNKKAMVGERIGITDVTIHYDRPGVKGREGQIWGKLVPYGFTDLGFGTSKAAPWRAGANENTTIEFSTGVKVEGKDLAAGKYAFFIATGPDECTLIFSKNNSSWGSFFYKEEEDALRVKVKPVVTSESVEWLKYEFSNETNNSAMINLLWEKWKISFKVEVDEHKTQMESLKRELRSNLGFDWKALHQAARYSLDNNVELEQGLQWANDAISTPFFGEANFQTLSTKAQLLAKLGRNTDADSLMKKALPMGNMNQIHNYARGLLAQKKSKEAFEVFKLNSEKNPNTFTTNMGMMRGYSAMGDYKQALEFAKKAMLQAPDPGNRVIVERSIKTLTENKDVNQ